MKLSKLCIAILPLAMMASQLVAGEIDKTLDVSKTGKVFIENDQGHVTIRGWDKAQVQVKGFIDERALDYRFETRGNRTEFIVDMPSRYNNDGNRYKESKLEIFVPSSSFTQLESVNADTDIRGLTAGVKLETVNGDIYISDIEGKINLESVNGDIDSVNLNGQIKIDTVNGDVDDQDSQGEIRFEAVNGNLKTNTRADDVRVEAVNGDIDLNLDTLSNLDISTVGGEVEVDMKAMNQDARIQVKTVSGDVTLKFPTDVSAEFEIASHAGGRIKNSLTANKVKKAKYGPSSSLEFAINGADGEVEVDTISGRIVIKKR